MKNKKPNDIKSERGVLGSILLDPQKVAGKRMIQDLHPDDFYDKQNSILFRHLMNMYKNGLTIDSITVSNYLKDNDAPLCADDIHSLQEEVIVSSHAEQYCELVKYASDRRKEIGIYEKSLHKSRNNEETTDETISQLSNLKLGMEEDTSMDVLTEAWLEKCIDGAIGHFNWWCPEWDKALGLLSNELMIFHAPRSTGKTALALQWLLHAHRNKHRVPLASIEMLKEELCGRFVSNIAKVNSYNMRISGFVSKDEQVRTKQAIEELRVLNLCIRDKSMTITQICTWARSQVSKGVSCIMIDNLLSISDGGVKYQSKTIMYDHFIRELRNLRDSLKCPIILLAHPNEETGRVAWSKDVENFADVILYMANVPHEGCDVNGKHIDYMHEGRGRHVLIKFQKNRQGISPCASVKFELETQSFTHVKWEDI